MKQIDKLILKTAFKPFVITLVVTNFVFLTMALYRKLDDIVGKGLGIDVIGEFVMYISLTLIPRSLPLAVLIASVMTLGNLGESYELVAIKSAGVSLMRTIRSLIIATIVIAGIAFYFSNNVLPFSLKKMSALQWDIRNKKPTMLLTEGVFFSDFEQMTMKIERKNADMLYDITIYDHRKPGITKVIKADSAWIDNADTLRYMKMHLMNGKLHEDSRIKNSYTRFGFQTLDIYIDMSSFEMGNTDENNFNNNPKIKNISQLEASKDSIATKLLGEHKQITQAISSQAMFLKEGKPFDSLHHVLPLIDTNSINLLSYSKAISRIHSIKNQLENSRQKTERYQKDYLKHQIEFYSKFALAFSCIILFFIGASLGALVRKGGFGMPILVSIVCYMVYYIINIFGQKFTEDGSMSPLIGMWLSTIILLPIALWLLRLATADKKFSFIE